MVAVEPDYCHQCGAELVEREIHGRRRKQCPDCGYRHFRNAVPSVDVIVRDGSEVLLIEQADGELWEFPGGHPEFDEEPVNAAVRELEEETGLTSSATDLELVGVVHGTDSGRHYNMVTYSLDASLTEGPLRPGDEAADVAFWSTDQVFSSPERTRTIDHRMLKKEIEG